VRRTLTGAVTMGAVLAVAATTLLALGASPAAAATGPRKVAYITTDNTVYVYDYATDTVNAITNGFVHPRDVRVTADGRKAYVSDNSTAQVSVLETGSSAVVKRISTDSAPTALALSADQKRLYVADSGSSQLTTIDTATDTAVATLTLTPAGNPAEIALTPNDRYAYISSPNGYVWMVDTTSGTQVAAIPVALKPNGLAVSPDGARLYVTTLGGTVAVIDTATKTVINTITVGTAAQIGTLTPDGRYLWVTNPRTTNVTIVDTTTGTVTGTVAIPIAPNDITFSADGHTAHVLCTVGGEEFDVDTATHAVTLELAIGSHPVDFAVAEVTPTAGPTAHVTAAPSADSAVVTVDAKTSATGFFAITSYAYSFGDGSSTISTTNSSDYHTYAAGTYTVTVTVTDAVGATSTATTQVTVRPLVRRISLLTSALRYVTGPTATTGATPVTTGDSVVDPADWFAVIDLGGGAIALRADGNQRFLALDSAHNNALVANAVDASGAAAFRTVANADGSISLLAVAVNRYVSGNNGAGSLTADRTTVGPWEKFHQGNPSNANVDLLAMINSRYVTAENAGKSALIARATTAGPWEKYDVLETSDGYYALFSHANNKFVTAENAGASALIARATTVGDWEKFSLVRLGQTSNLALLAHANGRYVTAENAGKNPLIARATTIGSWETFNSGIFLP